MGTVALDGYETGVVLQTGLTVSGTPTVGTGRDGIGVALRCGSSGDYYVHTIAPTTDEIYFHTATTVQPNSFNRFDNGADVFRIYTDGGTINHLSLNFDSTGRLLLRRGATSGTIIATSTLNFPAALAWHSFQVKVIVHDTTGVCVVKVDGVEWINFTGDTRNGGTSTRPDRIHLGAGNPGNQFVDDFLVNDTAGSVNNSWTGEVSIVGLRANGDGGSSQLVGSDGNSVQNYLQVDEYPLTTTDYNGSPTVGQLDTYAMTNVGKTGTVLAVREFAYAAKSDAGASSFKHVMRNAGGTMVKGAAIPLSTSYLCYPGPVWETDPAGAAWTVANVDALELGFEVA